MQTIVGIFTSREAGEGSVAQLVQSGIPPACIVFLSGERPEDALPPIPTTDTEADGMGKTMGGFVGGVAGASAGLGLGSAVASLMVPGIGPILAAGIGAAALLGIGGAAVGAKVGEESEHQSDTGVPRDDLGVYRELLKQGRTLVVVETDSEEEASQARAILDRNAALDLDAERKRLDRVA
jgi:hypothetical protein